MCKLLQVQVLQLGILVGKLCIRSLVSSNTLFLVHLTTKLYIIMSSYLSGVGLGNQHASELLKMALTAKTMKRWLTTDVLIIDESS